MTEIELMSYIETIQKSISSLKEASKTHNTNALALWDASRKQLELVRNQTDRYQELQSQLNLVLLFVTKQLSTTEKFAEFVADVVEANEACQGRTEIDSTHDAARALLEGGLKNYLPAGRQSRPASPKPLPCNVVLFPARPASRLPEPPDPPEIPESLDPDPKS